MNTQIFVEQSLGIKNVAISYSYLETVNCLVEPNASFLVYLLSDNTQRCRVSNFVVYTNIP